MSLDSGQAGADAAGEDDNVAGSERQGQGQGQEGQSHLQLTRKKKPGRLGENGSASGTEGGGGADLATEGGSGPGAGAGDGGGLSSEFVQNYLPFDLENPDYTLCPDFDNVPRFEVTVGPGDVLYQPYGWWHQVYALPDEATGLCASVSHFYTSYWCRPVVKGSIRLPEPRQNPVYTELTQRMLKLQAKRQQRGQAACSIQAVYRGWKVRGSECKTRKPVVVKQAVKQQQQQQQQPTTQGVPSHVRTILVASAAAVLAYVVVRSWRK
jgi:hypothetical protein